MNIFWQKRLERVAPLFILILIGANILSWIVVFYLRDDSLKVVFFDVDQGDSIFIETPQKHQILMDGGPSPEKILEKLGKEMPFYDRSIDVLILTHPEADHLRGLLEVLKYYKVNYVLYTGIEKDTLTDKEWENLLKEKKPDIIFAKAGEEIISGKTRLEVIYPFEKMPHKVYKENVNDTSVVILLNYGNISFLFTGDISKKVEEKIAEKESIKSDILKVAHHGSKTSSSDIFLKAVNPEIAVISVGKDNRYGYPHKEVLERLKKYGIQIFRTDKEGDIIIKTNGFEINVNPVGQL